MTRLSAGKPWTAEFFVCVPRAGALVDRVGERRLIVLGMLLQAVGIAAIALAARPGLAYAVTVVPMVITGVGMAFALLGAIAGTVLPTASEAGHAVTAAAPGRPGRIPPARE